MMSASYHKITTSYHLLLGLVLSASVLFTTTHADAQLKPTDKAAKDYRQARRLIEKDADRAFELAKGLPKFRYADEQRISGVATASQLPSEASESTAEIATLRNEYAPALRALQDANLERGDRIDAKVADEMRALDVLGLESDADFATIKRAWREKAKTVHPDVKPGDKEAAAEFQKLQVSYEVLKAAEARREWMG